MAPMSIIEIRTLGGAIRSGSPIPTGICNQDLFSNLIILYVADGTSKEERNNIREQVSLLLAKAKKIATVNIDFGGTQIQADDPGEQSRLQAFLGTKLLTKLFCLRRRR